VSSSVPGTSLEEMLANGRRISTEILALPYIQTIEQEVGRAELSEDTWGPHQSEFHVELKPDAVIDQIEAQDQLRTILARYPGLQSEVVTFLGDRIGESLTGETAQVAIKVYGDDLEALDRVGTAIVQTLSNVNGVVDVQFARQSGTPALTIGLVAQALSVTGLKAQDVLDAVQAYYAGLTVGQTYVGTRSVDVVLLLSDALRHQPEQLSALMITGPFGPVPLSQVARVQPTEGRYAIDHEGGQRRIAVTFNVQGRSLQSTVGEARARLAASVVLPPGSHIEFTGAAEAERQTRNELLIYSSLALVVIIMILFMAFHWRAHPWLVMANLPFSLIGGIVAIWLTGVGLSLGALVGLVTVFGISARNAILLLAHYEHLVENENRRWIPETILLGANERLVPILMTAMVTALGLAPLAVGLNQPGQEIEGPMAITVLGGLLSSTLLNLLLLPALAERYGRPQTAVAS